MVPFTHNYRDVSTQECYQFEFFEVEAIYKDATSAGSKYRTAVERIPYLRGIRSALRGRAIHVENWQAQLRKLL
jgi:hypothetical protein